ncbi:MAG: Crp/Fnr family transcriptional regulator [Pseudomonadota bacterium]
MTALRAKANSQARPAPRLDVHNSDVPAICRACESRHKGICGSLSPDQLVQLSKHTSKQTYASQAELVGVGDDVHSYSNILSGVVKLTKLMSDGRQQIVGLQFAPDFLGRIYSNTSNCTAEAATNVRVCSFPKTVLEEIIRNAPGLEHALHEQALRELDEARDWMLTLGRKTASEKVASFLYLIASHIDPEVETDDVRSVQFELPLKRAEIADFLGLTIETVSRQLTKLRKERIIEIENNRMVSVRSLDRLLAACEIET